MGGIRGVCGLDDYMGYWDLESLEMKMFGYRTGKAIKD